VVRVEQRDAIAHCGIRGQDRPERFRLKLGSLAAEHHRQPIERAEIVIDQRLPRDRDNPAIGRERVLFGAVGQPAVAELLTLATSLKIGADESCTTDFCLKSGLFDWRPIFFQFCGAIS
jgi:hypothetical protein